MNITEAIITLILSALIISYNYIYFCLRAYKQLETTDGRYAKSQREGGKDSQGCCG